jgi:hypothetical protein
VRFVDRVDAGVRDNEIRRLLLLRGSECGEEQNENGASHYVRGLGDGQLVLVASAGSCWLVLVAGSQLMADS